MYVQEACESGFASEQMEEGETDKYMQNGYH